MVCEEARSSEGRRKEKEVVLGLPREMQKLLLGEGAGTSSSAGE